MFASKDLLFTRPSGYQISRSVRLRSSASGYFNRTFSTPTSATIWTWSAWVKRGGLTGTYRLFGASTTTYLTFNSSDQLNLTLNGVSAATSTAVFRDPSSWYHIVYQQNGSAQTIYVNNASIATGTTAASIFNTAIAHQIGAANTTNYFDGYLTEINFIDGQALTPSSFGSTNAITGVWSPIKYAGTYGTNGFYLNFSDNSNNTATTIGKDYSGNGNNWTPNNISVTAGTTYDSMTDVPTLTSPTAANYCVLNPITATFPSTITVTNGNLTWNKASSTIDWRGYGSMQLPKTGQWYWEVTLTSGAPYGGTGYGWLGIADTSFGTSGFGTYFANGYLYVGNGNKSTAGNSLGVAYGSAYNTNGIVIGIAYDAGAGTITFYNNNTSQGVAYSSIPTTTDWYPAFAITGNPSTAVLDANFGQRPFTYTPPTGYVALNTQNFPVPTISNGANYMAATLYTGTGASLTIANTVGSASFYPDFVWVKGRSGATDHALYDSVRGTTKDLASNTTAAETTQTTGLTAFGSTGFTVGALAKLNTNAATYVGWQWNTNGGSSSSNTSGSITSTVSAGATQGFSVVTYTGTGANATVGHGLGVAPKMVIVKLRSGVQDWIVWQTALAGTEYLLLDTTAAKATGATFWNSTTPTSTVFSIGSSGATNTTSGTYVAYCFAAVAGYSAFGSYTGNGSADGPFVFTNFQPRWVMVKRTDSTSDWYIWDTSRDTYNVETATLLADTAGAETSATSIDGLSNGFKCRSATVVNASGGTYIYAAFASSPFRNSLAR